MVNEEEIYKTYHGDEERGFKLLLSAYQEPIYYFIRRMVVDHDDAEDVMQETFIRVYRNLGRFRRESSLSSWIYKIASNECMRFLNHRKKELTATELLDDALISTLKASEYVDYDQQMAVHFQEALLRLPDKQRLVFNLRYYDELEYDEISKITGMKAATLKVDFHYAKEKIKNYMTKE